MTVADAVILATIGLGGLIGVSFGFVHVVLGIAGWAGAVVATLYGFPQLRGPMREWIGSPLIADAATGLALFLTTLVILTALTHFIARGVRRSALGALDRSVGLVFGLMIGLLAVCGGFLVYSRVGELPPEADKQPRWIQEAHTMRYVEWGAGKLLLVIPRDWGGGKPAGTDGVAPAFDPEAKMEELLQPAPGDTAPKPKEGYNDRERREMDRLFETQQGPEKP